MQRSSILSGVIAGAAFLLAVAIVAGVLAAKVLAADLPPDGGTTIEAPATETPDTEAPVCDTQQVVADEMWAGGWVLDAHLTGSDIAAFLELTGPMPSGFGPGDFKAVQIWGVGQDGRAILFLSDGGCARFVVDGPRHSYQSFVADLRAPQPEI